MSSILETFPALVPDVGVQDVTPADHAADPYFPLVAAVERIQGQSQTLLTFRQGPGAFEKFVRAGGGGANLIWKTFPPGVPLPLAAQQLLAKLETFAGYDASTVAASVEAIAPGERARFIKVMSNPAIPIGGGTGLAADTLKQLLASGDAESVAATWDYLWVTNLILNQDTRSSFQKTLDAIGKPFVDWGNNLIKRNTTGGTWYTNGQGQSVEIGGNTNGFGIIGAEFADAFNAITHAASGNVSGLLGDLPASTQGPTATQLSGSSPPPKGPGRPLVDWILGFGRRTTSPGATPAPGEVSTGTMDLQDLAATKSPRSPGGGFLSSK